MLFFYFYKEEFYESEVSTGAKHIYAADKETGDPSAADRSLKVPDITGSWFLGYPYIPKGEKWPTGTRPRAAAFSGSAAQF